MQGNSSIEMIWGVPEWDNPDFVVIPKAFLRNYAKVGLSDGEAMLIIQLASFKFAVPGSVICPTVETLAKRLGVSESAVHRRIRGLKGKGLRVKERPGRSNLYDFGEISRKCRALEGGVENDTPGGVENDTPKHKNKKKDKKKKQQQGGEVAKWRGSREVLDVVAELAKRGVHEKVARQIAGWYDHERILKCIKVLDQKEGIENPGGWIVKCLKEGWDTPEESRKRWQSMRQEREKQEREILEKLEGLRFKVGGREYQVEDGFGISEGRGGVIPPGELITMYMAGEMEV